MIYRQLVVRISATVLFTALTACGGGSGGSQTITVPPPPPPVAQKGIEGGGIVNRFGASFLSVTVGGTTYDTTASALVVTIDDQPAMLSDLRVGNIVRVLATTVDNGVTASAQQIVQVNDLEGVVTAGSINLAAATFVVLGQTIRVVATTLFDDDFSPRSLEGLADNDAVEVSVLADGNGGYTASRIERDDDAGDYEITGTVSALDSVNFRFNIGALVVDYASAILDDFDNGSITDGDVVEVEGDTVDGNGVLIATSVENESGGFTGSAGDLGELEGFITRFVSSTDFDVDGYPVTTNAQTVYDDGSSADLALGTRVEVDGSLDAAGVLVAAKIDFEDVEDDAEIEFSALVDAIDVAASTVTVLGQVVTIAPSTALEDDSNAELSPFVFADISVGDFLEMKAYISNTVLIAVQLKRDDVDDGEVEVQGPATAILSPDLTVVGVMVTTTSNTEFEAADDTVVSAAEFFDALSDGQIVQAKGLWDGVTLTAREVEIED